MGGFWAKNCEVSLAFFVVKFCFRGDQETIHHTKSILKNKGLQAFLILNLNIYLTEHRSPFFLQKKGR